MRLICGLCLLGVLNLSAYGAVPDSHVENYWRRKEEQSRYRYYPSASGYYTGATYSQASSFNRYSGYPAPAPVAEWPGRNWDRHSWRKKVHPEEFGH